MMGGGALRVGGSERFDRRLQVAVGERCIEVSRRLGAGRARDLPAALGTERSVATPHDDGVSHESVANRA